MASVNGGELATLAFCWRLDRPDGCGLAVTSHDQALTVEGVRYEPAPGMVPAAVTRQLGLEPARGEVGGAVSAGALTERDLELGLWDGSRVKLTAVDWQSPDAPPVSLAAGSLGEVSRKGSEFTADLLGAGARLERPVCPQTTPECRAELGDKACRVDLAGRTVRATIVSAGTNLLVLNQPVGDQYRFGRLRYLRGECAGQSTVVLEINGAEVRVRDIPRAPVSQCLVELREGCDKRLQTCSGRFANAANFRGEPHLPGNDALTRYPGA